MELKECRDKIKSLFEKIDIMKKKNETDNVEPSAEERKTAIEMLDEIDALEEMAANLEVEARMVSTRDRLSKGRREALKVEVDKLAKEQKGYRSFGDFLQGVVGYYAAGGQVDPRLLRAATGMGETIPADGGLA